MLWKQKINQICNINQMNRGFWNFYDLFIIIIIYSMKKKKMFEPGEIKRNISMAEIQTTLETRWQKKMVFFLLKHYDLFSFSDHRLRILIIDSFFFRWKWSDWSWGRRDWRKTFAKETIGQAGRWRLFWHVHTQYVL